MRPATKSQNRLDIHSVWSESSLSAWRNYRSSATHQSDQTGRMPRLIRVFAGRTCHFVSFVILRLNCKWVELSFEFEGQEKSCASGFPPATTSIRYFSTVSNDLHDPQWGRKMCVSLFRAKFSWGGSEEIFILSNIFARGELENSFNQQLRNFA